jgi:hypothetical protein
MASMNHKVGDFVFFSLSGPLRAKLSSSAPRCYPRSWSRISPAISLHIEALQQSGWIPLIGYHCSCHVKSSMQ